MIATIRTVAYRKFVGENTAISQLVLFSQIFKLWDFTVFNVEKPLGVVELRSTLLILALFVLSFRLPYAFGSPLGHYSSNFGKVVTGIMTKGGAEGIGSLNERTNNVSINNVDISATTGDGIKLNNTNGLNIKNSKIHDLNICENNTDCEFAVFSPTKAPNSAVSAIGSQNINIDNVKIDDVTYGIFLASDYDQETSTYKTTTSNVNINNTSISNSRREGLLLVGNDNVTIHTHY